MSPTIRRCMVLVVALLVAGLGVACSKKDRSTNVVIPPLRQQDADDMIQQIALMMAGDLGGWLTDVESSFESMPRVSGPSAGRLFPASARPGFRTATRDTSFTRGGVNFMFSYFYKDTAGDSIDVWNDTVTEIRGISHASGVLTAVPPDSVGLVYHVGDPVDGEGYEAGSDTVRFSGASEDSLICKFQPAFRPGVVVFYSTVEFVDYDLHLLRDPAGNPYPLTDPTTGRESTAEILIFADRLRSLDPTDIDGTIDGNVTLRFDGTSLVLAEITNDTDNPVPQFRYRINIKTGAIQRL